MCPCNQNLFWLFYILCVGQKKHFFLHWTVIKSHRHTHLDSNNLVLRLSHFDKGEEELPDARVPDEGDPLGSEASFGFTAQQGEKAAGSEEG